MDIETWASVALRFETQMNAQRVADLYPDARRNGSGYMVKIGADTSAAGGLQQKLMEARDYLALHEESLMQLHPTAEFDLFIGWTPKSPQDSLVIDEDLVRLLSRLNCSITFDMYVE